MKNNALHLYFTCILIVSACIAYGQENPYYIARIDSLVKAKYDQGMFNGSILVKRGDEIIYKKAMGWANFEAGDTLKLTTPTRLASVTKSLTAVCVLKLVEEGKIDLHEDIHTYLPEIPKTGITAHHLLSHTSGIPFVNKLNKGHMGEIWGLAKSEGVNRYSNKHMLLYFERDKPKTDFKPGEQWVYRNIGFSILASLIERVSQISYGDYLKQNIFDPLGMENSFLFIPAINQKDNVPRAFSYNFDKKVERGFAYYGYDLQGKIFVSNVIYGDRSVYSTVEDMEKFNTAFLSGNIITSKYVELALTPVKLNSGEINKKNYGYGFEIEKSENGEVVVRHSGAIAYFGAMNMMVDKKYQIILLISTRGAFMELVNGCHDILEHKPLTVRKRSKKDEKKAKLFRVC